jgi:hypothetical protein
MKSTKLIGIHGPLNGGKDTVAEFIYWMDRTISGPSRWSKYAFAKPVKEACKVMFGFTDEQMNDRVLKEQVDPFWGFTPRKSMQQLGTEYGRDMLRKDVWIKRAELETKNNLAEGIGTIITDVRFENEAEWVRSQPNSILIFLETPGLKRDEKYNHGSESGIKRLPEDKLIINDKSLGLNKLYEQIERVLYSKENS